MKKKKKIPNAQASSESSLPPAPIQPFFQGFKQKILKPIFMTKKKVLNSQPKKTNDQTQIDVELEKQQKLFFNNVLPIKLNWMSLKIIVFLKLLNSMFGWLVVYVIILQEVGD